MDNAIHRKLPLLFGFYSTDKAAYFICRFNRYTRANSGFADYRGRSLIAVEGVCVKASQKNFIRALPSIALNSNLLQSINRLERETDRDKYGLELSGTIDVPTLDATDSSDTKYENSFSEDGLNSLVSFLTDWSQKEKDFPQFIFGATKKAWEKFREEVDFAVPLQTDYALPYFPKKESESIEKLPPFMEGGTEEPLTLPGVKDGKGRVKYNIADLPKDLSFVPETRSLTGFGHLKAGEYSLKYFATDANDKIAELPLKIRIIPRLNFTGGEIYKILLTENRNPTEEALPEAEGGKGIPVYALDGMPENWLFDSDRRILTVDRSVPGEHSLEYTVTDEEGLIGRLSLLVNIAPKLDFSNEDRDKFVGLVFTEGMKCKTNLPEAQNAAFSSLTYKVSGLPDNCGLKFDSDKLLLSGKPDIVDKFEMTYTVRDGDGNEARLKIPISIEPRPKFLEEEFARIQAVRFLRSEPISERLPTAIDGAGKPKYEIRGIPADVSFNDPLTTTLKGVPSSLGEHLVTYTATDENGVSAETKFKMTVIDRPVSSQIDRPVSSHKLKITTTKNSKDRLGNSTQQVTEEELRFDVPTRDQLGNSAQQVTEEELRFDVPTRDRLGNSAQQVTEEELCFDVSASSMGKLSFLLKSICNGLRRFLLWYPLRDIVNRLAFLWVILIIINVIGIVGIVSPAGDISSDLWWAFIPFSGYVFLSPSLPDTLSFWEKAGALVGYALLTLLAVGYTHHLWLKRITRGLDG